MAHIDHRDATAEFRQRVIDGIKEHFPVKGRLQTLELEGFEDSSEHNADDIRAQLQAKQNNASWAVPLYGNLVLKNNETGKVLERKKIKLADVPVMTRRYSYIVDGQEWQVDNQWQLRPGVYTKRRQTGELETAFNIQNKTNFDITFDPKTKEFYMERNKSSAIPIYPIMKTLGISDDTLAQAWGKDVLIANQEAKGNPGALAKFYKADRKKAPDSHAGAEKYVYDTLTASKLRADTSEITLGKPYEAVDGEVLAKATEKMLQVYLNKRPVDDRDSLVFKDLRSTGDFAYDQLTQYKSRNALQAKMQRQINNTHKEKNGTLRTSGIRDILKLDTFNEPIKNTFTKGTLSRTASQINPVEMISSSMRTTIMGSGGISSMDKLKDPAPKLINNSHLGFLDPIHTPESAMTGVSLHLPLGIKKQGKNPVIPVYDLKLKKMVEIAPREFMEHPVVLPDQVEWKDGKPVPRNAEVKASLAGNEMGSLKFSQARFVLRHASQLFDVTSNLIPFMGNTSGNRASYATHHIDQAISLEHREPALVQVGTGSSTPGIRSFEELLGKQAGHQATVDGHVVEVKRDAIVLADAAGKKHEVQLYRNFPLNDPKSMLDSTATVKVGEKVKAGQVIADTNYTKEGKLALGTNLTVAYIPYRGYNFEDGVVISESAAKKLSSIHMHKPSTIVDDKTKMGVSIFDVHHPHTYTKAQYKNIGKDGIVQVGSIVKPGDPLILATKPFDIKDSLGRSQIRKSGLGVHTDQSVRWDSDHVGEVVGTQRNKNGEIIVQVKTIEPMTVGDKISGRYGNKGIICRITPDDQMPHTKSGQHVEVCLNPSGIPGRINVGQVLETAAAKIAKKTGQIQVIENFGRTEDMLAKVQGDLKKHGLSDTEELHDPITGVSLGQAMMGPQYMLKLTHQVDKKIAARAGMYLDGAPTEAYDRNLMPLGGGKAGAQSMGNLGMYVMLAHGSKANIREMQTYKSQGEDSSPAHKRWPSQHNQIWEAIQFGEILPTPKPTFAFQKFTDMLRGAGINVEKQGHRMRVMPFTDKQILHLSNGELKNPHDPAVRDGVRDPVTGEPKPMKGSTYDPDITGGHGGKKWSHFSLAEPMPNPVFEKAIQRVLGFKEKEYTDIVSGAQAIDASSHKFVPLGTKGSLAGGKAIVHLLEKLDVKKELEKTNQKLNSIKLTPDIAHKDSTQLIDQTVRKVKYLNALENMGMSAVDAYTLRNIPVLPPAMRPISISPHDKTLHHSDLNKLYQDLAAINDKMKDPTWQSALGDRDKVNERANLYDGVRALVGIGENYEARGKNPKGILLQIAGRNPKSGYFQKTLLSRRQDLTMRSTITPEPAMGLDQVGLPTEKALTLFRPFVVKKLIDTGLAATPLDAQKILSDKKQAAGQGVMKALDLVMSERPVLLKRDPALHKHSVMAFNAMRVPGKAIQIHPLVTGGLNADFDGDTMSVYVPIHPEAVAEARNMLPSNNVWNEGTGKVMHVPTLESALGLYKLSRVAGDSGQSFKSPAEAIRAVESGKLKIDHTATIQGFGKTTPGRFLIATTLPVPMQEKMLRDFPTLDKSGLSKLYTTIAKEHRADYGDAANRLKDLGYDASFGAIKIRNPNADGVMAVSMAEKPKENIRYIPIGTHTLSLKDFEPDRETRDKVLRSAQANVDVIKKGPGSAAQIEQRVVEEWMLATKQMVDTHMKKKEKDQNNLFQMLKAGVKPGIEQYQQLTLAPMLLQDATGRILPNPVKSSYSEGLDVGGYWTQMHGARKGSVQKVQEVQEPGYFSKQIINTTIGLQINGNDCGTSRGIHVPLNSQDIYDRELASDVTVGDHKYVKGTLLSSDIVTKMRSRAPTAVLPVRSPLKCEHGQGLCQKCVGIAPTGQHYELGTNVGVLAGQSLGERAVQLTLKSFHSGGVAGGGDRLLDGFKKIQQLTMLPKEIPDEAVIAMKSGIISKIDKDKYGSHVFIDGQKHSVPKDRADRYLTDAIPGMRPLDDEPWVGLQVGQKVKAGNPLSDPNRTVINPHHLYKATKNIEEVQNHLVNQLHGIYERQGVRRQHIETVVKGMTNLSRVIDPGDAPGIIKGEFQPTSAMRAANRELVNKGKQPATVTSILQGINVTPLTAQEDWMAKLNFQRLRHTMTEAVATAAYSDLHGTNPIPGMAYGAQFGMTSKHKLRVPELHDIPTHSY